MHLTKHVDYTVVYNKHVDLCKNVDQMIPHNLKHGQYILGSYKTHASIQLLTDTHTLKEVTLAF